MKILSSILLIVAAANAATALAPRGKTRRTVVFAVALCATLACLLPILTALREVPSLAGSFDFASETVSPSGDPNDLVGAAAKSALSSEIRRRFGAEPREVVLRLPAEEDRGLIRIALDRRDAGVKEKIAAWLRLESGAAIEIVIEGEDTG